MILSEEVKKKIEEEYNKFVEKQYAGKTKKERQKLGQFFTPPQLTIKMLEKFEDLNGNILDPTCGAGGLLAAAILAGASPDNIYGIELDEAVRQIAVERLGLLGVDESHIVLGDALKEETWEKFDEIKPDANNLDEVFKIIDSVTACGDNEC